MTFAPVETAGEAAIRSLVPFVPVEGVTLADCARVAEHSGVELWRRLRPPDICTKRRRGARTARYKREP